MRAPGRAGPAAYHAPIARRLLGVSANPSIDKIARVAHLEPGATHRANLLSMLPGGKAVNVARAAKRLGLPAGVVALLAGHAGRWIEEGLEARGIPVRSVRTSGETRSCLSVIDDSTGRLTEFYEGGSPVDDATWGAFEAAVEEEVSASSGGALVVISGSLPPGAPADGTRRLAAITAAAGGLAAIDAGGPNLEAALPAAPWLVKVNAAEAEAAIGIPTNDEHGVLLAARALRDRGAAAAVITRGAAGGVLVTAEGAWRIGPSPVEGRYSVGSGDAFLAGMLAGVEAGFGLELSVQRGAAVAAAHAQIPGQGEFDLAEVDELLPLITLDRLD
jgi:1-phosphofructokinase family hexose kinase